MRSEEIRKQIKKLHERLDTIDKTEYKLRSEYLDIKSRIAELEESLKEALYEENPDKYWKCQDCGKIFEGRCLWKEPICSVCRNKRKMKVTEERLKKKLLGATVIDLSVHDEFYIDDGLHSITLRLKNGKIVTISAYIDGDYEYTAVMYAEDDSN